MTLQPGFSQAHTAPRSRPVLRVVGAASPAPDTRALALAQGFDMHAALRRGEQVLLVLTLVTPALPELARMLLNLGRQAGADMTVLCSAELTAAVRAGGGRRIAAVAPRPGYAAILDPYGALDLQDVQAALRPSGRYLRLGTLQVAATTGLRPEVFLCQMPAAWPREVFAGVITRLTQPANSDHVHTKSEFSQ